MPFKIKDFLFFLLYHFSGLAIEPSKHPKNERGRASTEPRKVSSKKTKVIPEVAKLVYPFCSFLPQIYC